MLTSKPKRGDLVFMGVGETVHTRQDRLYPDTPLIVVAVDSRYHISVLTPQGEIASLNWALLEKEPSTESAVRDTRSAYQRFTKAIDIFWKARTGTFYDKCL